MVCKWTNKSAQHTKLSLHMQKDLARIYFMASLAPKPSHCQGFDQMIENWRQERPGYEATSWPVMSVRLAAVRYHKRKTWQFTAHMLTSLQKQILHVMVKKGTEVIRKHQMRIPPLSKPELKV